MKLEEILNGVSYTGILLDENIKDVTDDSRKITPNSVFVCIKGDHFDGHDHALQALGKGAVTVVCQRDLGIKNQIIVQDTRYAYGIMCANFYGNPSKRFKLIGITGTNGKTTTATLIKNVLLSLGLKVGLIGTIQNEIDEKVIPARNTTPDAHELQELFLEMADYGCEYVVMEVSSHALAQHRLGNTHFDMAVFTNLTQDHLDYHKTIENYFAAKKKLFELCDCGIINIDDSYGKQLSLTAPCEIVKYSTKTDHADFYAYNIHYDATGVEYMFRYDTITSKVNFAMPGYYSVQNSLAAIAVCVKAGLSLSKTIEGINRSKGVKGRNEVIPTGRDFTVICDYAHSPDGLKNILPSIKSYTKGRLIVLFGCGGDRDKTKRPIMGEISAQYGDYLIVTSDNPRTEDPEAIIDDIMVGVQKYDTPYDRIPDRKQAIFHALKIAEKDDVIILAGKGHEDYQVLKDKTIHFDEREIVEEGLAMI